MLIRRFEEKDAAPVSALVIRTLRVTNARDYSPEDMEALAARMQPADILQRASWTHFYVAEDAGRIVGCGAVGPYWGREDESSLFTIFVLPECQGMGVGRGIVETLEKDEFFTRARRVEIPASVTALGFYEKMGYRKKPGCDAPDDEGMYRLEKFNR